MAKKHHSRAPLTVVIGDIVESRKLTAQRRGSLQVELIGVLKWFNRQYKGAVLSDFLVTLGDECQGVLGTAEAFAELVWAVETVIPNAEIRWGIGYGTIVGPLEPVALGMDGPAFYRAREAVINAKRTRALGGLFAGFGNDEDVMLNGFARLLHYERSNWSPLQRKVMEELRVVPNVATVAERLGVSRQDISKKSQRAGGRAYFEAETAWRLLLTKFDTREKWGMSVAGLKPAIPPASTRKPAKARRVAR